MRYVILSIIAAITLSGCDTLGPVKTSFPDLPPKLMEPPAKLNTIRNMQQRFDTADFTNSGASNVPLSVMIKSVIENYGTCNEYREQILSLQAWLSEQKRLNP